MYAQRSTYFCMYQPKTIYAYIPPPCGTPIFTPQKPFFGLIFVGILRSFYCITLSTTIFPLPFLFHFLHQFPFSYFVPQMASAGIPIFQYIPSCIYSCPAADICIQYVCMYIYRAESKQEATSLISPSCFL
jgi:hypothetical protein